MNLLDEIKSITIQKSEDSFTKSCGFSPNTIIIWANIKNGCYPIAYIKKPKGVSVEDWNIIKEKIEINILK